MQNGDSRAGGRRPWWPHLLAVGVVAVTFGAGEPAASLAIAPAVTGPGRDTPGLLGSIAIGALVLGVLGWAGTTLVSTQISTGLAAGLGVAVGGGLGAMIWFLSVGDSTDQEGMETVAVDMEGEDRAAPTPEPADLFAANPDPIVYFAGERPVVRTVNPAFEETFGVAAGTLEDADLAEAVMAAGDADDLVAAIDAGDPYDEVRDCETVDGTRHMRLRLAVTAGGLRPDGYLLYTPVSGESA